MPKVAVRGITSFPARLNTPLRSRNFGMQNVYLGYWSEINIRAATCAIFLAATAKQAPEKPASSGLVVAQVPRILLSIG